MSNLTDVFLGVDSGGTYLRGAIIDSSGKVFAASRGQSANIISVGETAALQNLTNVVNACLSQLPENLGIKDATFGLGGVSTRKEAERWFKLIESSVIRPRIHGNINVTNDTLAALWEGATALPAIALVGGTGSHCLGIDESGRAARSSGMEYLLTDEGGAYYIGDCILRAVAKACDGRGKPTALRKAIFDSLGITSLSDLYDYIYSVDRIKQVIAGFAPLATEVAENGDEIATQIIMDAAEHLSQAVQAVAIRLGLSNNHFEVVTIGSLFDNNPLIRSIVKNSVESTFSQSKVIFTSPDAAIGAAKLARDGYRIDIWSCQE